MTCTTSFCDAESQCLVQAGCQREYGSRMLIHGWSFIAAGLAVLPSVSLLQGALACRDHLKAAVDMLRQHGLHVFAELSHKSFRSAVWPYPPCLLVQYSMALEGLRYKAVLLLAPTLLCPGFSPPLLQLERCMAHDTCRLQ